MGIADNALIVNSGFYFSICTGFSSPLESFLTHRSSVARIYKQVGFFKKEARRGQHHYFQGYFIGFKL